MMVLFNIRDWTGTKWEIVAAGSLIQKLREIWLEIVTVLWENSEVFKVYSGCYSWETMSDIENEKRLPEFC